MILNQKKQTDIKLDSGRECGFGLSLVEAASYERMRRDTGLEVGIRFSSTLWNLISARPRTVDSGGQMNSDLISIIALSYSAMSDSSHVMVLRATLPHTVFRTLLC